MHKPDVSSGEWAHGYFAWLCELVACPREYVKLLKVLDSIQFHWILETDANRADDGVLMRDIYGRPIKGRRDTPCTVLEMLIGSLWRADQAYGVDPEQSYLADWFWEALGTADFLQYSTDMNGDCDWDWREVVEKVEWILDRKYPRNGEGNFWYIPKSRKDERKHDIWNQIGRWVGCRYSLFLTVDRI